MAQYKVPQDVEADDKLLGPFSFRQFVYLLIAGGLVAVAVGLFQLFPLLAVIPVPVIIFFVVLALPLKKDQPMETYLAALVSYYLKPRTRLWTPGQRESTIKITAPKIVEEKRVRDISGEEANHRLSFLADIVDTGGYSIRGGGSLVRDDLKAEANAIEDMFDGHKFNRMGDTIQKDENERHAEVMREMKEAIEARGSVEARQEPMRASAAEDVYKDRYESSVVIQPDIVNAGGASVATMVEPEKVMPKTPKPSIIELANNSDYSVETIAKEAKRINEREGEVFISLH